MNAAQRIIELDEKLDEVIMARGQRVHDEIEFRREPDESGMSGVGAALGGTVLAGGAGYGAYKYNQSLGRRAKKNRALAAAQKRGMAKGRGTPGATTRTGMMKEDLASMKQKGMDAYDSSKGRTARAFVKKKKRGIRDAFRKVRQKVFKYEEPTYEDILEFMMGDSTGKGYGDMYRAQEKAKKNTRTARGKRMVSANVRLMQKKFNALPKNKKIAVLAALGVAGAGAGALAAS